MVRTMEGSKVGTRKIRKEHKKEKMMWRGGGKEG